LEAMDKKDAEWQKNRIKFFEDAGKNGAQAAARLSAIIASGVDKQNRNNKAGIELDLIKAQGKKRLDLNLQLLDEEERQELLKTDLTENEKALIIAKYAKSRAEAEQQF